MKIAIAESGSGFTKHWVNYCLENSYEYCLVNPYDSNLVELIKDYPIFIWHFRHDYYIDSIVAKPILFSLENCGKTVFPDIKTCWHFDDKLAQKYLFEAFGVNTVKTWAFFSLETLDNFAISTGYPVVFKLKGGAGSQNVRLVNNYSELMKLARKSFGVGHRSFDGYYFLKEKFSSLLGGEITLWKFLKSVVRSFLGTELSRLNIRDKGYILLQKFVPSNSHDIRVIIVGSRAFAIKRFNRVNDFRASGSGKISFNHVDIDISYIKNAFVNAEKLNQQVVAFDYLNDLVEGPLIVEISYGFSADAYWECDGYWTNDLIFYSEKFNPYGWMIEDLLRRYKALNEIIKS